MTLGYAIIDVTPLNGIERTSVGDDEDAEGGIAGGL